MEAIAEILKAFGWLAAIVLAFFLFLAKKKEGNQGKDYDKIRKEKEDELNKKSPSDIVDSLDNSDDVERIKQGTNDRIDDAFNRRKDAKDRKRRELLDGFRSSGSGERDKSDS